MANTDDRITSGRPNRAGKGENLEPDVSFHDIGKLINWDAVGLRGHEFESCVDDDWSSPEWGIDPSAVPWQSILTWHKRWHERWPGSMHQWHARAADHLMSGYARPLSEDQRKQLKAEPLAAVYCLWHGGERQADPRMRTAEELKDLIAFLNKNPAWQDAVERYERQLRVRPEDVRPGFDVTSLAAHCAVVGKLARVLSRADWTGVPSGNRVSKNAVIALKRRPSLIVSHFRLGFRQRPFRTRDLGVFAQMECTLNEIAGQFPDNVLTLFEFECIAAFESDEARTSFLRVLEKPGFTVREQVVNKTVGVYAAESPDGDGAAGRGIMMVLDCPWQAPYTEKPPPRIDLPICEGCQMAKATKHWPTDHVGHVDEEEREEDLCQQCFDIRRQTPPVPLLRDWEDEDDVLYLRIALDLDRLAGHDWRRHGKKRDSALKFLHKQYLRSLHSDIEQELLDQLFVSFPMVVDFVTDYREFLQASWQALEGRFTGRIARLDSSLVCVGIDKRSESLEALEIVAECFGRAFPRLLAIPKEVQNPIGIALSLSNKKHPFFDHWRFLSEPAPDISIQAVGSGRAQFRLCDLQRIIQALTESKRSQLHRLAAAASISKALGTTVLRERDRRGIVLDELSALVPDTLDIESARILANLMEG